MTIKATAIARASRDYAYSLGNLPERVFDQIEDFRDKNLSILLWFKFTGAEITRSYRILGNRSTLVNAVPQPWDTYWSIELDSRGRLLLLVNDLAVQGVREITPGIWYHLGLIRTFDGLDARYRLYLNANQERDTGLLVGANTTTKNNQPVRIGVGLGQYTPCAVDDLYFINEAITEDELEEKARTWIPLTDIEADDRIARHYRFNEEENNFIETRHQSADAIYYPDNIEPELTSGAPAMRNIGEDVQRLSIDHEVSTLNRNTREGQCRILLDNHENKYGYQSTYDEATITGDNTGIRKPLVTANLEVKVEADFAGDNYPLFFGKIRAVDKNSEMGNEMLSLECADGFSRARDIQFSNEAYENVNPRELFVEGLNSIGYPQPVAETGGFDIARISDISSADTIPFAWFEDNQLSTTLRKLLEYGHYFMYMDGAGIPHVETRDEFIDPQKEPLATLDSFYTFDLADDLESLYNVFRVTGKPRRLTDEIEQIATLDRYVRIDPGQTEEFFLGYRDPETDENEVPAIDQETPVAGEDYNAFLDPDGIEENVTDSVSLSVTFFATTALVTITNNHDETVYLTDLQLRGRPARRLPTIYRRTDVTSSINYYGPRELEIESDFISTYSQAREYSEFLAKAYSNNDGIISVGIRNNFPLCLTHTFGDLLRIQNSRLDIDDSFYVTGLRHTVDIGSGLTHTLELSLFKWE